MHQFFGDAQVGGGTYRKKFGEAFDDAQQNREQIVAQLSSKRPATVLQKIRADKLRRWVQGRGTPNAGRAQKNARLSRASMTAQNRINRAVLVALGVAVEETVVLPLRTVIVVSD